jgi:hypothetical protein
LIEFRDAAVQLSRSGHCNKYVALMLRYQDVVAWEAGSPALLSATERNGDARYKPVF